jgi:hypothetical protein
MDTQSTSEKNTPLTKEFITKSRGLVSTILNHIFTIVIMIVVAIGIFEVGRLYEKSYATPPYENGRQWTSEEVTVGFTAQNGFIIYNHVTKRFDIYDKLMGDFIFHAYADKLYRETKEK